MTWRYQIAGCLRNDREMLVRVEKMPQVPLLPIAVRVHAPVGVAVVVWCGAAEQADGQHHVEWSVDEGIFWGRNTRPTALAEPGLRQDGDEVVLRGRLDVTGGEPVLEMGDSQILFDLAAPLPDGIDVAWVEVRVEAATVSLWPYQL